MKRRQFPYQKYSLRAAIQVGLIFSLLLGMIVTLWSPAVVVRAGSGTVTETFSTTTFRDTDNTTADWLTSYGVARNTSTHPWSTLATGLASGDIESLVAVSATTYFAVARQYGLFKTTDTGATWTKISGLPSRGSLTVEALDENTIWVGMINGAVYRTTNGGTSWASSTPSGASDIQSIAVSPNYNGDGTVFAVGTSTIHKSIDGGATWTAKTSGITTSGISFKELALSPTYQNDTPNSTLLFVTASGTNSGVYRSTNGGDTWTAMSTGDPTQFDGLAIAPNCDPTALCTVMAGSTEGSIIVNTDAADGDTWVEKAVTTANAAAIVQGIAIPPSYLGLNTDIIVVTASGYSGVHRATNVGGTWVNINNNGIDGHDNAFVAVFSPDYDPDFDQNIDDPTLLVGMRIGVFKTTNVDGVAPTWTGANSGLAAATVRDLERVTDSVLYAATDGGLYKTTDGGSNWARVGYDDYGSAYNRSVLTVKVDPNSTDTVLIGVPFHGIYRSTDAGVNFTRVHQDDNVTDLFLEYTDDNATVIAGLKNTSATAVISSTNDGATWAAPGGGGGLLPSANLVDLAVSPNYSSDSTVFVAINGSGVYRSTNGGGGWSQMYGSGGGHRTDPTELGISPTYNGTTAVCTGSSAHLCTIYVGFAFNATAGSTSLIRSTDLGATWSSALLTDAGNIASIVLSPSYQQDSYVVVGQNWGSIIESTNGTTFSTSGALMTQTFSDHAGLGAENDFVFSASYSTDQTIWMATDGAVYKTTPTYATSRALRSTNYLTDNAPTTRIRAATVTPTATTPTNTSVAYQLAAGNASAWTEEAEGFGSGNIYGAVTGDNAGEYIIAGDSTLIRSKSGGIWSTVTAPDGATSRTVYSVITGATGTVYAGAQGLIMAEDANPLHVIASNTTNHFYDAAMNTTDNDAVVVVGQNGSLYRAAISGGTIGAFSSVTSGTTQDLYSVDYVSGTTFIAVGEAGTILRSTNNGVTWSTETSGTANNLYGLTGTSNPPIAVGAGGTVLANTSGTTWTARTSNTTEDLYAIGGRPDIVLAVGNGGVILKSTDSIAWAVQPFNYVVDFRGIACSSDDNCLVAGAGGYSYLTTNGSSATGLAFETFTAGVERSFTDRGTALYLQATLSTTDTSVAPSLDSVAIAYTTNEAPVATASSPAAGASGVSTTPTLSATYADSDSDNHAASQWQILDANSNVIYNSGLDFVNLTSVAVSSVTLNSCTAYQWRVRMRDRVGDWGSYTALSSFTTTNCGTSPASQQFQQQQQEQVEQDKEKQKQAEEAANKVDAPTHVACTVADARTLSCAYSLVSLATVEVRTQTGDVLASAVHDKTGGPFRIAVAGLAPNTRYEVILYAVKTGISSEGVPASPLITFAQNPLVESVVRGNDNIVSAVFTGAPNPPGTGYAIEIALTGSNVNAGACLSPSAVAAKQSCLFKQSNGTFSATPAWATLNIWHPDGAAVRLGSYEGTLTVLARNVANILAPSASIPIPASLEAPLITITPPPEPDQPNEPEQTQEPEPESDPQPDQTQEQPQTTEPQNQPEQNNEQQNQEQPEYPSEQPIENQQPPLQPPPVTLPEQPTAFIKVEISADPQDQSGASPVPATPASGVFGARNIQPSSIPFRVAGAFCAQSTSLAAQTGLGQRVRLLLGTRELVRGGNGEQLIATVNNLIEGTYTVWLEITEPNGYVHSIARSFTVNCQTPLPPIVIGFGRGSADITNPSGIRTVRYRTETMRLTADGTFEILHHFSYSGITDPTHESVVFRLASEPQEFSCAVVGTAQWTCGFEAFLSVGNHTVSVAARDAAGNHSAWIQLETFSVRPPACSDNLDNDNDGRTDFPQDTGCVSIYDDNEVPTLPEPLARAMAAVIQPLAASGPGRAVANTLQKTQEIVAELQENPRVVGAIKQRVAPLTSVAPMAPFISLLALNNLGLLDIPNVLIFFFLWLLERLHLRPRHKQAGQIYDAVSKGTLPMARVQVYSQKEQRFIASTIASLKGAYALPPLSDDDAYYLQISKPKYSFPTNLIHSLVDKPYENIYRGDLFTPKKVEPRFDVPLDPDSTRATNFWKIRLINTRDVLIEGFHLIANITLAAGALVSLGMYFVVPQPRHLILFGLYLTLAVLSYLSRRSTIAKPQTY